MKDQVRTPLRTVLRNFLNHIEKLESSINPEKSYEAEFQDLKLFSESVKTSKEYACAEGEKETNRKKNRYKDILPFDLSRVVLNEYAGIPGSDYINANFIKGASGSPAYIASQGPLPSTVNDFWRMVVQCEVQVIVMACNVEEAGKAKCEKYWVDDGEEKQFGMISVKLLKASTVCPDFSVRTMRLKYTNSQNMEEERTVCQLHYVAWPDHGVPTNVQPLLDMVRLVRDTQASETLPVLVHCSAGCGRTGTICAIDYVWGLLRTGKLTDDFSLLALIREMRKQRIAMVQTKEQYVLVHQAVRELFKEQLLMIDSHPYENINIEGLLIIKEEENHYDTVENLSNISVEEKKDNTMEKDVAPPLPQKKHPFYSSKQEKDVENLSAQQRSISHSDKTKSHRTSTNSNFQPLSKPLVPMDGASHNLQAPQIIPKKPMNNPIPSKGILRVPHLKSLNSTAPVKRSRSLKLSNIAFKQRGCSTSTDFPAEMKRRSLESNIDESASVLDECGRRENFFDEPTMLEQQPSVPLSTLRSTQLRMQPKYDLVSGMEEKRLLVRSLTTFDMRQRNAAPVTSPDKKPIPPDQSKCRLARSNTQVDFSRVLHERIYGQKVARASDFDGKNASRRLPSESQAPLSVHNVPKPIDSMVKFPERRNRSGISGSTNHASLGTHQSTSIYDNPKPSYKMSSPGNAISASRSSHPKDRININCNGSATKFNDRKLPSDFRMLSVGCSNYGHVRLPSGGEALYSEYPSVEVQKQQQRVGTSQHSQAVQVQEPLRLPGEFTHPSNNGDDAQRFMRMNGSAPHRPVHGKTMNQVPQGAKHLRGPPSSGDSKIAKNSSDMRYHDYGKSNPTSYASTSEMKAPGPIGPQDPTCSRYAEVHNIYAPLSRPSRNPNGAPGASWPGPYRLPANEPDGSRDDRLLKSHKDLNSSTPGAGANTSRIDHVNGPAPDSTTRTGDYFSNAPGVDIDQVAASIPQKDASKSNLMKVALEAFNLRRSRRQARLPEATPSPSSSKGSSSASTAGGSKKRQQQYL